MKTLIFGCGYVGMAVAEQLARQGHQVFGVRRGGPELNQSGIEFLQADITNPPSFKNLPGSCDWVVNCVSSSGGSTSEYRKVYLEGTRNLLEWLSPKRPRKFVYTSSTGVYGQDDGSAVDETSPTVPASDTGKVLVETERLIFDAVCERKFPGVVLRLAGIYGPGRGYWLKQFLAGEARLEGKGERILNMIHRDDAAGAILAALERAPAGSVYNVVDHEPARQLEVFKWLAQRLDRSLPLAAAEGATGSRRSATNKAVCGRRLRAELNYQFKYPTFREGFEQELR